MWKKNSLNWEKMTRKTKSEAKLMKLRRVIQNKEMINIHFSFTFRKKNDIRAMNEIEE